jgi:hypothetical protein
VDAEIQQHRLLEPGVYLPAAIDFLRHAILAAIQSGNGFE